MVTGRNFIIFAIFLAVFAYAVWGSTHSLSVSPKKVEKQSNVKSETQQLTSQRQSGKASLLTMLKQLELKFKTQQLQLKQQQIAINKLFVFIESKVASNVISTVEQDTSDLLSLQPEEEYISNRIENLNNEFDSEGIDQRWSRAAVDKVSDALNKVILMGSAITQLDCQSTFCKIAINHESDIDSQEFLDRFIYELGWETSSFIQTSDDQEGNQATVVYLSRDGYNLPEVF